MWRGALAFWFCQKNIALQEDDRSHSFHLLLLIGLHIPIFKFFFCIKNLFPSPHLLSVSPFKTLKRKEKEYEHEMERLAREKIATQQRLAELKNELSQSMDAMEIDRVLRQTIQPEDDQASTSTASGKRLQQVHVCVFIQNHRRNFT